MTSIKKVIRYVCDNCEKEHEPTQFNNLIVLSGEFEGRSDMPYEFHFCNRNCLEQEYNHQKSEPVDERYENEYLWILEREVNKQGFLKVGKVLITIGILTLILFSACSNYQIKFDNINNSFECNSACYDVKNRWACETTSHNYKSVMSNFKTNEKGCSCEYYGCLLEVKTKNDNT